MMYNMWHISETIIKYSHQYTMCSRHEFSGSIPLLQNAKITVTDTGFGAKLEMPISQEQIKILG